MKILKKFFVIFFFLFFLPMVFIYFFQENLIFNQQPLSEERVEWIRENYPEAQEVTLETAEGIKLHGWYVKNSEEEKVPLIIYFGGNSQEVSEMLEMSHKFENWSLLAMNYRGYGLSEGKPGQEEIYNDAGLIYDTFKEREDIDPQRIVIMGWSLGSAPAVYLSKNREVAGTILVSPFDSLKKVASKMIPLLPVEGIIRHPFDSLSKAPSINVPSLTLIASEDRVIRPSQSKRLMASWGGEWHLEIIEGRGHGDIFISEEYWEYINAFLEQF